MLRIHAEKFIHLGMQFHDDYAGLYFHESLSDGEGRTEAAERDLKATLARMGKLCGELGLPVAKKLVDAKMSKLPSTSAEMEMLWTAINAELEDKLFLFVPAHKADLYENAEMVPASVRKKFPKAAQELRFSGNAYALGLNTASTFHCMRALEHGLSALAENVSVKYDIQNWQNILDQISSAVSAEGKAAPRGAEKNERLQFLSEAVAEFRWFKDGWRNHVSHNKVVYDEDQARKAFDHVCGFIEVLSRELGERP